MVDNKMYRWCFCFCYHSPLSLMNQYLQIMKSGSCTYPQYVIRIFSGKSLRITHVRPVFLFTVWKIGFTKNPGKIQSRWIFAELFRCQSRDFCLQAVSDARMDTILSFCAFTCFLSSVFGCCPFRAGSESVREVLRLLCITVMWTGCPGACRIFWCQQLESV